MLAKYLGFDKFNIEFNSKKYSGLEIPHEIPAIIFGSKECEQFTWIVYLDKNIILGLEIPHEIPIEIFGNGNFFKLNLLFKKIKPVYVDIEYNYSL